MAVNTSGIENLSEQEFLDNLATVTGNTQSGDSVQNISVTDIICEGPIKGLVGKTSGVYFNDVSAEYAEYAEFVPTFDDAYGTISFPSGSTTGTLQNNLVIPEELELAQGYTRSLVLIDYAIAQVTISKDAPTDELDYIYTATRTSGVPFSDSRWTSDSPEVLDLYYVGPNGESLELYTVGFVSSTSSQIKFYKQTNFASELDTTKTYSLRRRKYTAISSFSTNRTSVTVATPPHNTGGTLTFAFRITEPQAINSVGVWNRNNSALASRGKIDQLQIQSRNGEREQDPITEIQGVGGGQTTSGNPGSLNLPTIKMLNPDVASDPGINVALIDPSGMPTDSTDYNEAPTIINSTNFGIQSGQAKEVDQLRWSIKYPSLQTINLNSGAKESAYAYYIMQVRFKRPGSTSFESTWRSCFPNESTLEEDYIVHSGNTNAPTSFDHVLNLAPFGAFIDFQIRIIRVNRHLGLPITSDGTAGGRTDRDKWQISATGAISTLSATITDLFNYPYTAVVSSTFSSRQFGSIPKRSYLMEGLIVKVPDNYTPREYTSNGVAKYDGIWTGGFKPMYTDNPAWVFYDIVTNNRYGAGKWISRDDIDEYALYRIAKYCDELVPSGKKDEFGNDIPEPRFRANVFLAKSSDVYKVLKDMATIFLGILYWQDGKLTALQDCPQDPIYNFSKSNVIDGKFSYESTGTRTRINQVVVTWNDPEINYEPVPLIVEDREAIAKEGRIISQNSVAFGATSEGQAIRYGRWKLWTAQNQTEVVSFKTSLAAHYVKAGDVITIQDADRYGLQHSGRVRSSTSNGVVLDREVEFLSGADYTLNTVVSSAGAFWTGTSALTVSGEPSVESGGLVKKAYVPGQGSVPVLIDSEEKASNAFRSYSGGQYLDPISLVWRPYTYVQQTEISNPGALTNSITTTSAFDIEPTAGTVWSITESNVPGNGEIDYRDSDRTRLGSTKEYRILSISEDSKNEVSITAVEHFNSKYKIVEEGYEVAIVNNTQRPSETGAELIPKPRSLRITVDTDIANPSKGLSVEWDAPESTDLNANLVTRYELYHNVPGLASPIITSETIYSFEFVPAGVLSVQVRSLTRKNNRSGTVGLEYEVPFFDTNIDRWQEGIPKGVIATSTLVYEKEGELVYFEEDPSVVASLGSPLQEGVLLGEQNSVSLEGLNIDSWYGFGVGVDHYIGLVGGDLKLMHYDTETFTDFPYWKVVPGLYSWTHPGIWDIVGAVNTDLSRTNTVLKTNHGLKPGDKVVFAPAGELTGYSALQLFWIARDWPGYVIEAFQTAISTIQPINANVKVRISNVQQSITLLGGGYLSDGEYYTGNTNMLQQNSSTGIEHLYYTYEGAVTNNVQDRVPIDRVVGTTAVLRVVWYPANVISVIDNDTFIIDRTIDAEELRDQGSRLFKRNYSPDLSSDSIFAKVRYSKIFNTADDRLEAFTRYINLDTKLFVGKYVAVTISDPLIQYSFSSEEQITQPGAIEITATAIGFKDPRFAISNVTPGISSDVIDQDPVEGTDGTFIYKKIVVPDGTAVPYRDGIPEEITVSVSEFNNITTTYEGVGVISKTTAGADGVAGKTVYLDSEDLTIIYNEAGQSPVFNNTDGDATTLKFTADPKNFVNPRYKFTLYTDGLQNPSAFTLSYPEGVTPDGLGFVTSPVAYVAIPLNYSDWRVQVGIIPDRKTARYKIEVEVAEADNLTTSEAFDNVLVQGIHGTKDGYWTSFSNPSHSIPTTSVGVPLGDTIEGVSDKVIVPQSGTTIEVGKGAQVLEYVEKSLFQTYTDTQKLGKYTITSIEEVPTSAIVLPSGDAKLDIINSSNPQLVSIPDFTFSTLDEAAWPGNTASVTYTLALENTSTTSRSQIFTKSKQGFGGIVVLQKNQFESVPVDKNDTVLDYSIASNSINVLLLGIDIPYYPSVAAATAAGVSYWWTYEATTPVNISWSLGSLGTGGELGFVDVGVASNMTDTTATVDHTIRVYLNENFEDYTVTQTITQNKNGSNISAYVNKPHYSFDGDGGAPNPSTGYLLNWITTVPEGATAVVEVDSSGVAETGSSKTFSVPSPYGDGSPIVHEVKLYNGSIAPENLLDVDTVVVSKSKNAPDGIILDIDNDAATVGGIEGQNVTNFSESVTATVFKAGLDDTANWEFTWDASGVDVAGTSVEGVESGVDNRTYTVTGLNNSAGGDEFTFANIIVTASHKTNPAYSDHQKTFTITKILNGKNGVVYKIIPNTDVVTYDSNTGVFQGGTGNNNNEVSFNFIQIEDGIETPFSGKYSFDGGTNKVGPASVSTATALIPGTLENVTCSLYSADEAQLYDRSSVPLVKSGVGAKTIAISSSSQNFIKLKNGTYTPSAIILTAKKLGGVTGTSVWSGATVYKQDLTTPAESGDDTVYLLPSALSGGNSVTVNLEVTDTSISGGITYTDSEEIGQLEEGSDAITISLQNDNVSVTSESNGVVTGALPSSGTDISVYQGATLLDYDGVGTDPGTWTVVGAPTNGIIVGDISESGNLASVGPSTAGGVFASGSANEATIAFNVSGKTLNGTAFTGSKVQTFSKAKKGDTGVNGRVVKLTANKYVVSYNKTGGESDSITFTAEQQNVVNPQYEFLIGTTVKRAKNATNTFTLADADEPAIGSSTTVIVKVYENGTDLVATDSVSIYGVQDGKDAITGFLTNPSHVVATENDGTGASFTGAGGTFKVFLGSTDITTQCTFGEGTNTGTVGASINSTTGVYSVTSLTTDTATVPFTATVPASLLPGTSNVTVNATYSISKSKKGPKGSDGGSVNIAFTRSATQPNINPTSAGSVPTGTGVTWYDDPPTSAADLELPLWAVKGEKAVNSSTWSWGTPYRLDGDSIAEVYFYSNPVTGNPASFTAPTYDFVNSEVNSTPTGWNRSPPSLTVDGTKIWVRVVVYAGVRTATNVSATSTSDATIYSQYTKGPEGDAAVSVSLIYSANGVVYENDGTNWNPSVEVVSVTAQVSGLTGITYTWTGNGAGTGNIRNNTFLSYSSEASVPTSRSGTVTITGTKSDGTAYNSGALSWNIGVSKSSVSYTGTTEYYKITDTDVAPARYSSGTTIAAGWQTTPLVPTAQNPYLWNFNRNSKSDGSFTDSAVSFITLFVKGIQSISEDYQKTANGTNYPTTGTWAAISSVLPLTEALPYLWNRTTVTFTDGSTQITYSLAAVRGPDGVGTPGAIAPRVANGYVYSTQNSILPIDGVNVTYNFDTSPPGFSIINPNWSENPPTFNSTNDVIYYAKYTAVESISNNTRTGQATEAPGLVTFGTVQTGTSFSGLVTFLPATDDLSTDGVNPITQINGGNIKTGSINASSLVIGNTTATSRLRLYDDRLEIWDGALRVRLGNLNP